MTPNEAAEVATDLSKLIEKYQLLESYDSIRELEKFLWDHKWSLLEAIQEVVP